MFCQNCGAELASDAQFCENCGTKIEETHKEVTSVESTVKNNAQIPVQPKKMTKKTAFIIGIVGVAVIALIIILANRKTTINLADYINVEFSGYDTLGTAQVSIDYDALKQDYGDKIKYYGTDTFANSYMDPYEIFIEECVNGTLDTNDNLTSGDTVTYTWDCDEELAKSDFKIKLKAKDTTYTVSGLEPVKEIDPFENIEVIYEGTAPRGSASVKNNSTDEYISGLNFEVEPSNNLNNGSKVVVSVSDIWGQDVVNYYVENYGIKLTTTEKEFTVEGLGSYITSLDEIPEDTLTKMKSQSEDALKAYAAQVWDKRESLDRMTYIGNYLLSPKISENGDSNIVYMVYKVQASDNYEKENIHDNFSYYYYTSFKDVAILPDGTCSLDLNEYNTPSDSFKRKVQYGKNIYNYDSYFYKGYETLDALFNKCVTSYVDNYEYEANVTDIVSETENAKEESVETEE